MNENLRHVATDIPDKLRDRMQRVIKEHGLTMRGFMRKAILKQVIHYEKSRLNRKKKELSNVESN